ncbi:MAG: TadE family protein [Planctomycetota bacterium]
MTVSRSQSAPRQAQPRRGTTAVEFAMIAPVFFLFVFGAIEFSRVNMVLHTCRIAAVEGARRGVIPGADAKECEQAALDELAIIGISASEVEVQPNPIKRADPSVTVTVRAPVTLENGFAIPKFFLGKTIETSATFQRESPGFTFAGDPTAPIGTGGGGGGGDDDDD